jgi:hypothetical protein
MKVVLSDLAVIALDKGPKVRGIKRGRERRSLRAIKIRSTTYFEVEVELTAHVVTFCGMLNIPTEYVRDISSAKLRKFLSNSLLRY